MRVPWLTEMEGSDSHCHLSTLSPGTYLRFVSSKGFGESMLSYLLLTGIQLANTFLLSDPGPKYHVVLFFGALICGDEGPQAPALAPHCSHASSNSLHGARPFLMNPTPHAPLYPRQPSLG